MKARTLFFAVVVSFVTNLIADEGFDVRQHLSSVSRYDVVKDVIENQFGASKIPDKCTLIHLNLLARHGTRAPTKKKNKEFDALATRLSMLLEDAKKKE